MHDLTVFNYKGKTVRTVQIDGEPWWVAKDVCDVFGETNRNRAMKALSDDEKGYTQMSTPGGEQQIAIISESGLYSLLLAMQPSKARGVDSEYIAERKEKLRSFRRWVTHDVLPAIRKHGMYATDELLNNPDLLIRVLQELKSERALSSKLAETVGAQEQQITKMIPKARYYDVILACKDAITITVIAKDYGWSAIKMNKFLYDCGVQYKLGKVWLLYQDYADNGYTVTKTNEYISENGEHHSNIHTYWTQKGRYFIYELLKEKGILPVIERNNNVLGGFGE